MNELICFNCKSPFDLARRQPRVLPVCGHTYCSACIRGWVEAPKGGARCPEDGTPLCAGLDAFPLNIALGRLLGGRATTETAHEGCAEHAKPAELVCTTDHCLVCADCVLFGAHKSHEYVRVSEFAAAADKRIQNAKTELEALGRHSMLAEIHDRMRELRAKIENKRKALSEALDKHFEAMRRALAAQQTNFREKIDRRVDALSALAERFEAALLHIVEREQDVAQRLSDIGAQIAECDSSARFLVEAYRRQSDPTLAIAALAADLDAAETTFHALNGERLDDVALHCQTDRALTALAENIGVELRRSSRTLSSGRGSPFRRAKGGASEGERRASDDLLSFTLVGDEPPPRAPKRLLRPRPAVASNVSIASLSAIATSSRPRRLLSSLRADGLLRRVDSGEPPRALNVSFEASPAPSRRAQLERTAPRVARPTRGAETVSFAGARLTDAKLDAICAELSRNAKLRVLVLDNNRITNFGFEALLKRLSAHETLEKISLANNLLDDGAIFKVGEAAKNFKSLRAFGFSGNRQMRMFARAKRTRAELAKIGVFIEI